MFKRKYAEEKAATQSMLEKDRLKVSDEEKDKIETRQREIEAAKPEIYCRSRFFSTVYQAYNNALRTISKYVKYDPEIFDWIVSNFIAPELGSLSESELSTINDKIDAGVALDRIGSIVLDKETFSEWGKKYKEESISRRIRQEELVKSKQKKLERAIEKAEQQRELERARTEEEKRRNDEKVDEYKNYFKSLNKAQQKAELEWFKKKLIQTYTNSEDEADELIHELEMISLAD